MQKQKRSLLESTVKSSFPEILPSKKVELLFKT